ncbi:MAG: hypothetical protein JW785_10020, partial [Acidimicrobiia bacterium]|nr:hypothetical protein [Acidimicrobiia bacterium]
AVADNTCPAQPATIPAGGTFSCSFDAYLAGEAGDPDHANAVTAAVEDDEGNPTSAADDATVSFDDVLPALAAAKTASVGSVPEPGGTVTFLVEVENLSVEPVTLTSLGDDLFGDLRFAGNPAVANNTCPAQPATIPVGGTFSCAFDAYLAGDAGDPDHRNTVTAAVEDDEGNPASAADDATVAFSDILPSVAVAKTPSVGSVPEPGAAVTFAVTVENTAMEPVTVGSLADDVFGDLLDPANPAVVNNTCPAQPATIPVGGSLSCSFDGYLAGNAGDPDHIDTVSVVVSDDEGNPAGDSDSAAVSFGDTAPAIDVHKGADPGSLPEPGGTVTFSVVVANLSVEAVTLTSLTDDVFGDLLDPANAAVTDNSCPAQAALIPAGGSLTCSFDAHLVGDAEGPDHHDRVNASVVDDEGNPASGSDDAVVPFTDVLPVIATTKTSATGSVPEPGAAVVFAVAVENMAAEDVTLWSLADSVFGDLLDPANPAVTDNTCPAQPLSLPAAGTFSCSFEGFVGGGFGDPDHVDTVTAGVRDNDGNLAFDADEATVAFSDVPPALAVAKSPSVVSVLEPGATVTFTVEAANLSVEAVTVAALMDDVFGDLLDTGNPLVWGNTCPARPPAIPAGGTFSCSFDAFVAGDAGDPDHRNTVTAAVADDDGNLASGRDDAVVAFGDALPVISTAKSPSVGSVEEPGRSVTFTVEVANPSVEPVTLVSLGDDVFGDLLDAGNPLISGNGCPGQPRVLAAGGLFSCSFDALVAGDAGDPDHRNTVTAAAVDDEGNQASAADEAVVGFTDVLPSVAVGKTPSSGAVPEPGGTVAFTVEVANTSAEPVTLTSLSDDVLGDLLFPGNPAVANNTCPAQPAAIPVLGTFSCSFDALVAGNVGDPDHHNTVTAAVVDDEGNAAVDDDDATVVLVDVLPSIAVTKNADPGVVSESGGSVRFTVSVTNRSVEAVTLLTVTDDVFGDLLDAGNAAVTDNTCPGQARVIPVAGTLACSFDAYLAGEPSGPAHRDTVTALAVDDEGNEAADSDDAVVSFLDALPSIAVAKAPSVGSVPESGAVVGFTVEVRNTSPEPITLLALDDDVFGDLLDAGNTAVVANTCPGQARVIPVAGTLACSFEAYVAGDASGPAHTNTVSALAADDEGNPAGGADEAQVLFGDVTPSIDVAKHASVGSVPEPGATVTFEVEVRNTSPEPLRLTRLQDSVYGNLLDAENAAVAANTCPARPTVIPVGGVFSCSFAARVSGDGAGGDHRNTVTARAVDGEGNIAEGSDIAAVAIADVPPAIAVTKAASVAALPEPGGMVTFSVEVTNLSVEGVSLGTLMDSVFGDLLDSENPAVASNTCPEQAASIPVGGTLSCSFEASLVGNAAGRGHANTVTAVASDDEGNSAADADDALVAFQDVVPTIDVAKEASIGSVAEPGAVVTFTVAVVNTSAEAVTLTSLTDDAYGDLLDPANPAVANSTCPGRPAAIPVGGIFACSFAALVAGDAGDPDHRNVVTATVSDDEGNSADDADDAVVSFSDVLPMIGVAKSPTPGSVPEPGATVTFSVVVENLSVEPVTVTSLVDDVFGDLLDRDNPAVAENTCPAQPATLPPAGELACSFRAFVAGEAGGADHSDTITATATDDEGNPVSASAAARVSFSDVAPAIEVAKTPSAGSLLEPGGTVTFAVTVANASVESVTLTSLVDDHFGDLLDPDNPAVTENTCPAQPVEIAEGQSFTCWFEAFLAGDAGDPDHRNTVTATAVDDEGNTAFGSDEATVAFGDTMPIIEVAKAASPGTVAEPGGMVSFAVEVVNTSAEPVTLTSLVDDHFGDLLDPDNPAVTANTCPAQPAALPVGGTLTCAFAAFVGGDAGDPDHRNTVTAVVVDDEGNQAVGTDDAGVAFADVLPGVVVAKAADPSAVDEPGGIVLFSVEVANTSVEPVRLTSLSDSVFGNLLDAGNGAVFANTCPAQPDEIPAGGTLACSFEALVEGEHGDPDHVNTITAVVADDEFNPASGADSAAVSFLETDAVVTGHLFIDLDGDGAQGPGEPHLPGVRVRLVDGAGNRSTITSDALGNWEAAVEAGVVSMRVVAATVPAGYRLTTANASQTVEALPGSTVDTADVGYQPADGSLAGKVFFDVNGDGEQGPGEPSFAGVAVALYQGDRVLQTVLTGADGSYGFDGLAAGEYRVVVRDDTGFFAGFSPSLDPDGVLDGETRVTLGTSEDRPGVDFAYRGTGSVGDTIWEDADGDGVQDPGEKPIAGIVVGLVWAGFDGVLGSDDDVTFPNRATDAAGTYLFTGVPAGVVDVAVDPTSVDDDLEATTATSYTYLLGPAENFLDGDIGFRAVEELPYTGFDADRLGFLSLGLIAVGLMLLLVGRRGRRDSRLRCERLG